MRVDADIFYNNILNMSNDSIPVLPRFKIDDIPDKGARSEIETERISAMIKSPEGVELIREIKAKGKNVSAFLEKIITEYARVNRDQRAG